MASGSQNNTSYQAQKWTNLRAFTIGATSRDVDGTTARTWSKDDILGASTSAYFLRGDKVWSNTLVNTLNLTGSLLPTANTSYNIGSSSLEWSTTYTRQIYARHFDASANFTNDLNMYYGYNRANNHYFYTMDGTTRTHRATINATGLFINQTATNRNAGIIGAYDYTKAALIWSMGASYNIAANGSGLGSLYGAAYAYQDQAYIGSKRLAGGHQFLWCENGGIDVALGSNGVWIKKNGGIYWDPYVESASDASDVTSIYQIASGVAGGTELRINQQNDAADCINLCTNAYIYLNSKRAFTINDSWLRINESPSSGFSSGVYFGSSVVRTDGEFWSDSVRLIDNWVGFYNAVQGGTRYGYIQANADRMYFRKENGTSTYAYDFAGTLYNSERIFINYKSGTWVNSLTNSAITLTDVSGSYGGWICGPTKDGRIAISTYQSSDNYLYFGYGERGRTANSFAQQIRWDGPNNILYTNRVDMAWLRVVNNSSNNSDDAMVYIESKTANDWAVKINKGGTRYGVYIDSLDQDDAIRTNGYIRARMVWANQGSNGERQVGVDSGTSGTLYLWSNTTDKGLYSSSGYQTGYVIRITSSERRFYGNVTGNATGLYSSGFGNGNLTYLQTSGSHDGNSGWCHYIIANHGDGATYYHYTIALPFWDVPMYRRQTGSTSSVTAWRKFLTDENWSSYCAAASHTHNVGQISWGGGQNLSCSGDNTEWSVDMNGAGSYWHVWSNSKGTCLAVYRDSGEVRTPFSLTSGYITVNAQNGSSEGGEIYLAGAPSYGYYAALDVYTNLWRIHSNGGQRFYVNLQSGAHSDYAEDRRAETYEPGRVYRETNECILVKTNKRLIPGCSVCSDTYGTSIPGDEDGVPFAVSGRALVYPEGDRNDYTAGQAVCSGPNGTISLMTREEIKEYPDCILGYVAGIPNPEEWNHPTVELNNRIWIRLA